MRAVAVTWIATVMTSGIRRAGQRAERLKVRMPRHVRTRGLAKCYEVL